MSARKSHLSALLVVVSAMTTGYVLQALAYGLGGRPVLCAVWAVYSGCMIALVVYIAVTIFKTPSKPRLLRLLIETYRISLEEVHARSMVAQAEMIDRLRRGGKRP